MTSNTHPRCHRHVSCPGGADRRSAGSFLDSILSWAYAALLIGLIWGGGSLMYQLLLQELTR